MHAHDHEARGGWAGGSTHFAGFHVPPAPPAPPAPLHTHLWSSLRPVSRAPFTAFPRAPLFRRLFINLVENTSPGAVSDRLARVHELNPSRLKSVSPTALAGGTMCLGWQFPLVSLTRVKGDFRS